MTYGRLVTFAYDVKGERSVKSFWVPDDSNPTKMILVHCGLVGFVRNGDYYNVITDLAGSTRLVIKDGRVVCAYDYLPYGQLMRWSGEDPSIVDFLFTGQEWDRETGLYNFHFRLYDPLIGRFYQIDAKETIFQSLRLRRCPSSIPTANSL